jgi:amino acid adenylation domain-containing protein
MTNNEQSISGNSAVQEAAPSILCVPDLVSHQAALTPEALAIDDGSSRLSYGELEQRSNRLGHHLRSLGVVQGSVVGLCLERSVDFPVAALAILKAGGAYLPLETKTPIQRMNTMLNRARVSVVVTQSGVMGSLAGDARRLVVVDRSASEISSYPSEELRVRVAPEDLAYVIYTSGSTGTPKAVAIGHDSLLNLVEWHIHAFGVTPRDRASQLASIGFDAAGWELWPYLVSGASVHLVDDETRTGPDLLRDWLVRKKITIGFAPTPLADRLIELTWPETSSLRVLLIGADTLHRYPPKNLPFSLVNNYGPTECTVVATSATVPPQEGSDRLPPIGRPIDNTEIFILDSQMKQVSAGQLGEIYIGGAGLARGYLNDSAMTEERFVKRPFGRVAGSRLYRTGDLGCFLPDGQIAFHGRVDDQVKIRGYRIELNEVVSALRRHSAIRETAVIAAENATGEKQLIAYIVPRAGSPSIGELRDFLAEELPDYMLPATFVLVDAIPVGTNGKVDRLALPAANDENILREETSLRPHTPTEQRVSVIVAGLLGLERVGVNENFFYLGGNSLFGTQLIARLRDAFGVDVPLLGLFDLRTVANLAAEIERLLVTKVEAMSEDEVQRLLELNTN